VTADTTPAESRPINPLAALTLVIVFPGRTFRRLVERPHWILPLVFVAASVVLSSLLLLSAGMMDDVIEAEAFRTGFDPGTIRSGTPAAMIVSGVIGVVLATLIQTTFYFVVARSFGGRGRFRTAFSAVCHASVPVGLMAILLTALIPFTKSADIGANLAFLFDPVRQPFLWGIASQIDVAVIWFFILLGIAAEPVFGLDRKRARAATVVFAVVSVLTLGWLSGRQAAGTADPYENWDIRETSRCTLHFPRGAPDEVLMKVTSDFRRAADRVERLTGYAPGVTAPGESGEARIDCYLYPSLDEKRRATGVAEPAHRVEWANAVHYAVTEGSEVFLARELLKLVDAQFHGKVYNPLIRDGLAVYAGGSWGGLTVRAAGLDLLDRRLLPELADMTDPVAFKAMDERISRPAAGSFIAYLIDETGTQGVKRLYSSSARDPNAVPELLASALGRPLPEIEAGWRAYLEDTEGEPGAQAAGQR
jgi:hypothetical protein